MNEEKEIKKKYYAGRNSDYKEEYCEAVIEYFKNYDGWPTVAGFASTIPVGKATIYRWQDEHDAFRDSLSIALTFAEQKLSDKTLNKTYDGRYAMFCARNYLKLDDTQKIEISGLNNVKIENITNPDDLKKLIDERIKNI